MALRFESSGHRLMAVVKGALRSSRSRFAAGAVALGVAAVGALLGPGVLARLGAGGDDLRAAYVAAATRIFAEAPVLGTGPGTWVIQRVSYTVSPEPDYYIPHAHNIYAQTLAELGIVGAIVGLLAVAMALWMIRTAVRDADPVWERGRQQATYRHGKGRWYPARSETPGRHGNNWRSASP